MAQDLGRTQNIGIVPLSVVHEEIVMRIETEDCGSSVLIVGPVGVGKTTGIAKLAEELGVGLKEIRVANYQETDFIGLPSITSVPVSDSYRAAYPNTVEGKTGVTKVVEWIQQGYFPDPLKNGDPEKGILLLDELFNAPQATQAALLQLLDASRSIGSYKLPPKWLIVATGNGPQDGGYYQSVAPALKSRFGGVFRVEADADAWIKWAYDNNIDTSIIDFIKTHKEKLWYLDEALASVEGVFPTPRAWENVSRSIARTVRYRTEKNGGTPYKMTYDDMVRAGVCVGDSCAIEFAAYYMLKDEMVDVDDIRSGAVRELPNAKEPKNQRTLAYMQVLNMARALKEDIAAYMTSKEPSRFNAVCNLITYGIKMKTIALDLALTLFSETTDLLGGSTWFKFFAMNGAKIKTQCPEYEAFYNEHRNLFEESKSR